MTIAIDEHPLPLAVLALGCGTASAQTYGFATLQPGTLNHTTASAVAKVLKEKGGMNVLVQPTAGDQVIVPMVGRGEVEIGISNIMEVHDGFSKGDKDLRIIAAAACAAHRLLRAQGQRHARQSPTSRASACPYGFSAMRDFDTDRARDARHRRTDREGHQARAGAQRDPQRRRLRLRRRRHVLFRLRRAEGARGRRHRRRHPRDRDRREGHAGRAQDRALGLPDRGQARAGLRRRREADEGLQLRQRASSPAPRPRTSSSTRSSTRW